MRANRRANDPVLQSVFLAVLDHSGRGITVSSCEEDTAIEGMEASELSMIA